ncbi:hypothetical protein GQ600_8476 [Phytophthora cactorum]|nr:hypothetical protein GQ600_8476 [Phytophthora cactorum]
MEAPKHALFPVALVRVTNMDCAIVMVALLPALCPVALDRVEDAAYASLTADSRSVWYLVARCEALTTDYAVITSINTWPSDKVKTLTASLEGAYYMYHTYIVSCTQGCSKFNY